MYNEILLDRNAHPLHKGSLRDYTEKIPLINAGCGDNLMLYLKIKDGVIADGSFEGFGCAVSQASTDILLDEIIGKSPAEARRLCEEFVKLFMNTPEELKKLGDVGALTDISKMPARVNCALLPWSALQR